MYQTIQRMFNGVRKQANNSHSISVRNSAAVGERLHKFNSFAFYSTIIDGEQTVSGRILYLHYIEQIDQIQFV